MAGCTPRQQVFDKTAQCFEKQPETSKSVFLYFIALEESKLNRLVELLHPLINNEEAFKAFLDTLVTKKESSPETLVGCTPQQQVLEKIAQCYEKQENTLSSISLYFYTLEESMTNRFVEVLHPLINYEEAFKAFLDKLVTKIESSETYTTFNEEFSGCYDYSSIAAGIKSNHGGHKDLTNALQKYSAVHSLNLIRAFNAIPATTRNQLIQDFGKFVPTILPAENALVTRATNALGLVNSATAKALANSVVVLTVCLDIYKQIIRFQNGEINGIRCVKNITDNLAAVGGGVGGGWGGAAIGTSIYPGIGTLVGAFIGGVVGSSTANYLSQLLTSKIFNVPREEALENAFRFLGLPHTASINQINSKFRELALKYHPDKAGSVDKFHQLQYHVAIIKASKE